MSHRRRLSRVLLAVPLVVGALPPASAQAAAAPAHLVSRAQAAAALPRGSAMPGKNPLLDTRTDNSWLEQTVCLTGEPSTVTFTHAHVIANWYGSGKAYTFMVAAVVFHTVADAKVGLAAVARLESHCPARDSDQYGAEVRTLSTRYAADDWNGWRSTDHASAPANPITHYPAESFRMNMEFLVRGNVLLVLQQFGDLGPGTGPAMEQDRKKATTATLAGFAKL
jgi:hypothetical protein